MTGRTIAIGALAAVVLALGVGLAIAVRGSDEPAKPAPPPPRPAAGSATVAPAPRLGSGTAPTAPYRNFTAPEGRSATPVDPSTRYPIPSGGFAAWTGREGTSPGEMEAFAQQAGIRLPVALEQHRSTLLEERTTDTKRLADVLGTQPTGQMLATIGNQTGLLHEATANAQVHARDGTISDDAAIRDTRAAEDAYRRVYQAATGLTDAQFDQLFAP